MRGDASVGGDVSAWGDESASGDVGACDCGDVDICARGDDIPFFGKFGYDMCDVCG